MIEVEEKQQQEMSEEEGKMQQLRSKAAEFLLREEWKPSIELYTNFISASKDYIFRTHQHSNSDPNNLLKLKQQQKSLCLALSNRAEARFRLREYAAALSDCDEALKIESSHFKTLICKGKILFSLNRYGAALDCFRVANLDPQATVNSENLTELFERCKKMEHLSKTGSFDISDWILNGFREKIPELPEYIGSVEIKMSDISGRGLFTTKNIDCGTVLLATKSIAIERGILSQEDSIENAQLVMWKNFIDKVIESATKCSRTNSLLNMLSAGENDTGKEEVLPQVGLFGPDADDQNSFSNQKVDMQTILSILDVNSLVEDSISSKVLGKYGGYYGIGLWLLASFINHSCDPNVRRLHIGDHVIIHASRDIKAGEELTFAYFDVLQPLHYRKEESKKWGFVCCCRRCCFEEGLLCHKQELKEVEMVLGKGLDMGGVVYRLEEGMKRWMVRGKGKGYLRASFWDVYGETYQSEKVMRRWGRKIPAMEIVVDSVVDVVGSDHRVVKLFLESLKRNGGQIGHGNGMVVVEMEKAMKFGRGIYGKTMKKQALRTLLQL